MFYINPRNMDKEQWLSENATQVEEHVVKNFSNWDGPDFPVIWVVNAGFTAAGVAPSAAELARWFRDPEDLRLKRFFLVKKEVLFSLHPELREALGSDNDGVQE